MRLLWLMIGVTVSAVAWADNIVRYPVAGSSFPISEAVEVPAGTKLLYFSGQGPAVLYEHAVRSSAAAYGDTERQTLSALTNIEQILQRRGLGMGDVVKMQVLLVGDPANSGQMDFSGFMRSYLKFFGTKVQPNVPARSVMQVAGLVNPGWLVQIDVVAAAPQ